MTRYVTIGAFVFGASVLIVTTALVEAWLESRRETRARLARLEDYARNDPRLTVMWQETSFMQCSLNGTVTDFGSFVVVHDPHAPARDETYSGLIAVDRRDIVGMF